MDAIDHARLSGIRILPGRDDFRVTCPMCSAQRRKSREPCLHVTILRGKVLWECKHCGWKGASFDEQPQRAHAGHPGGAGPGRGGLRAPRPHERQKRWW